VTGSQVVFDSYRTDTNMLNTNSWML